jgi:hypothetical protein
MESRDDRYAAAERQKDSGDLAGAVSMLEAVIVDDPDFALAHSALRAHIREPIHICAARKPSRQAPK